MKRFKQQCLVHAFIFFTLGSLNALAQTPVNRIVAIVDKGVILQNQLDEQVQQTYQRLPPEQRAPI